jgi:hypothetical protein
MTVADLIAELTKWPPEYIVTVGEALPIAVYPKDAEVHLE